MTGVLQVFCGLLIAGAVLALAACLSRRSHAGSEPGPAAEAAARPRVTAPAVITAQPRGEITGPYGYDNGVAMEES